jgi:hypothetical protein
MSKFLRSANLKLWVLIVLGTFINDQAQANPMGRAIFKSKYFTKTQDYNRALNGLLSKPWSFPKGGLKVWAKDDPRLEARPDHSELRSLRVMNQEELTSPEQLGLDIGFPLMGISAGPFVTVVNKTEWTFAIFVDDRPWGYDADRCFLFSKRVADLSNSDIATQVESISCEDRVKIKNSAQTGLAPDFSPMDSEGSAVLAQIEGQSWNKTVNLKLAEEAFLPLRLSKSKPKPFIHNVTLSQSFFFNWFGTTEITYQLLNNIPGHSQTLTPTMKLEKLGQRLRADGSWEFQIWATRRYFISQDASQMAFSYILPELWKAKDVKDWDRILNAHLTNFYCYRGIDCTQQQALRSKWHEPFDEANANFMVLRYNPAHRDQLEIQLHMIDPRFDELTLNFTRAGQ